MKKLLILTAIVATAGASVGCNCCSFRRRAECPPYADPCNPCDECQGGAMGGPAFGPAMGAPVYTTPAPTIVPGPASTTSQYLPR